MESGTLLTYTLMVTNASGFTVPDVTLIDTVPNGTTYIGASPAPTGSGPSIVWQTGPLANGAVFTAQLFVRVTVTEGIISNIAYANNGPSNEVLRVFRSTAIRLTHLGVRSEGDTLAVSWSVAEEAATLGYRVYRANNQDRTSALPVTLGMIAATGVSGAPSSYTWRDAQAQQGVRYWYWLSEVDTNGVATEYGPVDGIRLPPRVYLPLMAAR